MSNSAAQQTPQFRIVVAEDNAADVALVRHALHAHLLNFTIQVIRNGEDALEFFAASTKPAAPVDLVILDLHLPMHDGLEILQTMRATSEYARTPVIVMSSLDAGAPEVKLAAELANVCFNKPSSLDAFLELGAIAGRLLEAVPAALIRDAGR